MEEKYITAEDFMNVLELRSSLVYCSKEELIDVFKKDEDYIILIDTLFHLIDIDNCGFAILDEEITEKIYALLNYKRFDMRTKDKKTYNLINDIIIKLNETMSLSEDTKEIFRDKYVTNQEEYRNMEFTYYYEILDSMGIDSFIIDYLEGEDIPDDIPTDYLIGSIVYLNNTMPGLFQIDDVQNKIDDLLNGITYNYYENKLPNIVYKIKKKLLSR